MQPIKPGTRFNDHEGMQDCLTLPHQSVSISLLHHHQQDEVFADDRQKA